MRISMCWVTLVLFVGLSMNATAARFWVAAAPSNWNNPLNWSNVSGGGGGFSVPGVADAVTFNANGLGSCTIDAAVSVLSFTIAATYTGTIAQGAHIISTVNNATFSGGIFTGGTVNITIGGNFTLNGTVFTSTSAVLEFDGNSAFTSATFTHNNGTVYYNATAGTTISGTSPTFYILQFAGNGFNYIISSAGNITIVNSLNITGASIYNLNTGTIDVSGDINITNTATGCGGTALVNINGAGVQNFNGSAAAGEGALPQLTINKASGTLNLTNFPSSSNAFTYTAGVINAGTSTYCFTDGIANPYSISGSLSLNNIDFFALTNQQFTITAATTLTATGDFAMAGTSRISINTGNININGNIFLTNTSAIGGGTATINIIGAANETMDGTAIAISQNLLPFIIINKPSGTLTLKGNISASQDWTYTSGAVDASTFASTVAFGGNPLNVTSTGMSFYNITVTGNAINLINSLTIKNNLAITAGHIAPGANIINLAGNWNDYGTAGFTQATSTVNFNGSALQTITSPGGQTFANLTVNNTGPGIKLINNATVATVLTMTLGNIDLNTNTMTLGTGPAAANVGTLVYTAGTMINTGTLTRWFAKAIIAVGSSAGLFPLGNITDYQPFSISASVAPTTGGTVSISYANVTGNTLVSFPDGGSTVAVIDNLNWALVTGNGLAGGTYNLDAQGTGFGPIGNVSDLRLTLVGSVVGAAGVNAGTIADPQVNRTGLSLANLNNTFYIGSVNYANSPLPVVLISFSATVLNNDVVLNWSTADEINNDLFTVQRSKDASRWESIKQIAGAGNSRTTQLYTADDQNPYLGPSYYRLMLTDLDGNSTYSPIRTVILRNSSSTIIIYPNPATSHIDIVFPATGNYTIFLLNSNAQIIGNAILSRGQKVELNVADIKTGIYFIRIDQAGSSETRKVVISK